MSVLFHAANARDVVEERAAFEFVAFDVPGDQLGGLGESDCGVQESQNRRARVDAVAFGRFGQNFRGLEGDESTAGGVAAAEGVELGEKRRWEVDGQGVGSG